MISQPFFLTMADKKEYADLEGMRFHKNACRITGTRLLLIVF